MPTVLVPRERLSRWLGNFEERHGSAALSVSEGCLDGRAEDGSWFGAIPPFSGWYDGPAEVAAFVSSCCPPADWGILLVRKGGFAVARLAGEEVVASKVGQRHVQGRTKAGGQSQQRFARRRDNQARAAYEAAADHAARLVADVPILVTGGDDAAVRAVLKDHRLGGLRGVPQPHLADVPEPRRDVLNQAVLEACSVRIQVINA
jgi:hypothetical protein